MPHAPLLTCLLVGAFASVLPHLVSWATFGHWFWASGPEDLQFGFAWRLFAGATIGAGWYLALREHLRKAWPAALLAVFLMCDPGVIRYEPFVGLASRLAGWLAGGPPAEGLFRAPQWRLAAPGLGWGLLLFYFWRMDRARVSGERRDGDLAGACLGALIWASFHFRTAALLGLALAWAIDPQGRPVYLRVGTIGLVAGVPALAWELYDARSFPADWLERTDKLAALARLSELHVPKLWVAALLGAGALTLARRKDLSWLFAFACAALGLMNHTFVPAWQAERAGWSYALAPALWLLLVALGAREIERLKGASWERAARVAAPLLAAAWAATVAGGLMLRAAETTRDRPAARVLEAYHAFTGGEAPGEAAVEGAVVAGDPDFVALAAALRGARALQPISAAGGAPLTHEELGRRVALDRFLSGVGFEEFMRDSESYVGRVAWGPWQRDAALKARLLQAFAAGFREIEAKPAEWIARYEVRLLALARGQAVREEAGGAEAWERVRAGARWWIWRRRGE